jgi:hypothetical protein
MYLRARRLAEECGNYHNQHSQGQSRVGRNGVERRHQDRRRDVQCGNWGRRLLRRMICRISRERHLQCGRPIVDGQLPLNWLRGRFATLFRSWGIASWWESGKKSSPVYAVLNNAGYWPLYPLADRILALINARAKDCDTRRDCGGHYSAGGMIPYDAMTVGCAFRGR